MVSIIVITYNSGKYVLETLESIKAQTYRNIELIVSDDCSTDRTVELCGNWIEENKYRFVKTEIINIEKNTGIAPNCNRGLKAANGAWVKLIAGDDALETDVIEKYVKHIDMNPNLTCMYSNVKIYNNVFNDENLLPVKQLNKLPFNQGEMTAQEQFKLLLRSNHVWASTILIKKTILESIGGYNEKYPFFEDRPMLLALLKAGHRITYIDIFGAKYRRHTESVQVNHKAFFSRFEEDQQRFFINEYLNYYSVKEQQIMRFHYKKNLFLKRLFNNQNNFFVKALNRLISIVQAIIVK